MAKKINFKARGGYARSAARGKMAGEMEQGFKLVGGVKDNVPITPRADRQKGVLYGDGFSMKDSNVPKGGAIVPAGSREAVVSNAPIGAKAGASGPRSNQGANPGNMNVQKVIGSNQSAEKSGLFRSMFDRYKNAMRPGDQADSIRRAHNGRAAETLSEAQKVASSSGGLNDAQRTMYRGRINEHEAIRDSLNGASGSKEAYSRLADHRAMRRNAGASGPDIGDKAWAAGEVAKDYFWTGANKEQRIARIGTAVAGYGAAAGVGRVASGGTATYNSKGERDIVGVPFI